LDEIGFQNVSKIDWLGT